MPDFEKLVMRHGEFWIQSIIEQIERIDGIRTNSDTSLEARWQNLTSDSPVHMAA